MNMDIINMLKSKGIDFAEGLTDQEIIKIEQIYGVKFPRELQELFMIALPISKDFYNWRDFTPKNVQYIEKAIERPVKDIYEMANEVYWCDEWGNEPNESDRINVIRTMLKEAPILIPVFSHRYIPAINLNPTPIFSIHDTDIIYYGENLTSYFYIEFGDKNQADINLNLIKHVPFWSDLL